MLEKEIRDVFSASPDVLYAFADISYSSYAEEYKSALVTAFPYGGQLTEADYTEEGFEEGIQSAKGRLEKTVAANGTPGAVFLQNRRGARRDRLVRQE